MLIEDHNIYIIAIFYYDRNGLQPKFWNHYNFICAMAETTEFIIILFWIL